MRSDQERRVVVGMTGATGAAIGVRVLELLRAADVEAHLVMSKWAARTLIHETRYTVEEVTRLATEVHQINNLGAAIASGSFLTMGMVIAPCTVRTLAAISHGLGDNLIHRAADVTLKERRRLVLAVREAPLSDIHLENMLKLSRMGGVIYPPVPAFYTHPRTVDDIITQTASRLLDPFGIHAPESSRWSGDMAVGSATPGGE